jgi:hypothetical protein
MKTQVETSPKQAAAGEASLELALADAGWQFPGAATWKLKTKRGEARLEEIAHRDTWRQFELSAAALPHSTNHRLLHINHRMIGPAKFVARKHNAPVCRLDVPDELADAASYSFTFVAENRPKACAAWAQAVTEIATGNFASARTAVTDAAITAEIKQAGWSVADDNGHAVIHLQLPGIYRQLVVERDKCIGIRLAVNLLDLVGLSDDCLRAVSLLALAANTRLPLVRMAISKDPKSKSAKLQGEVSFGSALATGSLLRHALEVLETAVALTAREFDSLRDPELARRVVEAGALRNPLGQL